MDKKDEIVTINPLADTEVGKMIQIIRDKQVLLDRDLATLYGVETRRINEQVKRNIERFPEDFCFQLSKAEVVAWEGKNLKSNCDIKLGWKQEDAICLYRAGCRDAFFCIEKRNSN